MWPLPRELPLPRLARATAIVASLAIALAGFVAGAVRVLPWLLDPAVPWPTAAPFARGLAAVALEAALLVGWPVGWALACFRYVESGEARVLLTLGERPGSTVVRLAPQGAVFALVLSAVSLVYGSDAGAPGRVATELLSEARWSCAQRTQQVTVGAAATAPASYAVPFTDFTWLCSVGSEPRLVGSAPALGGAVVTATGARIAGDFRGIDLDDARVLFPGKPPMLIRVASLSLHGMAPWARASTLPAPLRAVLFAVTAWACASLAAWAVLRRAAINRLVAIALGATGPLVALGLLRLLERADERAWLFALVPVAAAAACTSTAAVLTRLRRGRRAAST
jgi:hypothetical protein